MSERTSNSEELVPDRVVLAGDFSSSVIFSQSSQSELNLHSRQLINAVEDQGERSTKSLSLLTFSLTLPFQQ